MRSVFGGMRYRGNTGPAAGARTPQLQQTVIDDVVVSQHDAAAAACTNIPPVAVRCIDYSCERYQVEQVTDLTDFLARHRPAWSSVRWINIDGLTDLAVIRAFAEKYNLHPLAVEDVIHVPQRPKAEDYPTDEKLQARLFVLARMLSLTDGHLHTEQVSFFLGHSTLITFQETQGDVWDKVRQRIANSGSRLRRNDASFLLYSLLDAIVDQCFPILECYSDRLEELEEIVLQHPTSDVLQEIHAIKRELLLLRRGAWPMREVINSLQREPHECMSEITRTYLRDVYDHSVQIIDLLETFRELASGLTETYMSGLSIRMNEIMKVLTIMGTIFIPLTFLAGVYGMNMKMPEYEWAWSYPAFWGICVATAGGMLLWFKRRGWV